MKLYGGHKQTECSWRPAKRPRTNGQITLDRVKWAVRNPELLRKGLDQLKKMMSQGQLFPCEISEIIEKSFQNGNIDPNKHRESYLILSSFYSELNNGAQLPTYQLG